MKKYIALTCALFFSAVLMAQKGKPLNQFSKERLPEELTEWMVQSAADKDKQKEAAAVVDAFRASYSALDDAVQERVVSVYNYMLKAKMKPGSESKSLTRTLTAFATAPSGGQNFDAWLKTMENFCRRNAKPKVMMEWVSFSERLLSERVLFKSNNSEWHFDAQTPFRIAVEKGNTLVYFDTPATLYYSSSKDGDKIVGTMGCYDYKENLWRGQGGRIDWSRTGLGKDNCYALLKSYSAETKFPKFAADSAELINTAYFTSPILGRVEDNISNSMEPGKYSYPRFRSYKRDFIIKDIVPEADYSGSFMMNGSKFITASSKHPASIIFRRGGKPQLSVTALKFTITPDRMVSENSAISLYLGDSDSISSTGILVRYNVAEHRVTLVNDPKRNFYSPFTDSYHRLDIFSDVITWDTEGNTLEFSNLSTSASGNTVTFESVNYYTYRKAREIQGIDNESPVVRVFRFSQGGNTNFSLKEFSNHIGLDLGQTQLMIHNLSRHGLVSYNEMTGRVLVKDKLQDYMKASSKAKGYDYDAISLESTAKNVNATLNLDDRLMKMNGVKRFVVSDSQRVFVYPKEGNITVGKNRSIHFDGRLNVGRFIMFVSDCDFSYENFDFEMPVVDSMYFYVPEFNNPDTDHLVMTPLYQLVGRLSVDKPDNHCGLAKNKDYPIFESRENSFVYFDRRTIRGGTYDRSRFYYTLLPFTITDLVDFETDSLQFRGVLTSGGIFPDIEYPLSVQRDYYLGFRHDSPSAGYPTYGGKGTYFQALSLDHHGLQGNGSLNYLTSTTTSRSFLFLLDSMVSTSDSFFVREEKGFPDVHGGRLSQHWLPYADSMALATLPDGRPMSMYHGDALLTGRLDLMPSAAAASGTAQVKEGTLVSPRFALAAMEMSSEVSDFTLRSSLHNSIAFSAKNVSSHVDYNTRQAELRSADGPHRVDLHLVQQQAFADLFSWDMDSKLLAISNSTRPSSEGMDAMDLRMRIQKRDDLPGVRFLSTDPEQHGRTYNSLNSQYDYERGQLSSRGVFLLNVADAAIAPGADTLHVEKGGALSTIRNAQLLFNRDSAYHFLVGVTLDVASAHSYTGKGYMDYHNDTDRTQRLFLNDISVDSRGVSIAKGHIGDSLSFKLSSAFGFAGDVRAEADHEFLFFEGGVRLLQECIPEQQMGLLSYSDYTDPEHVHIAVPENPTNWKGDRIAAAIVMDKNTLRPHAAFLTDEKLADNELIKAYGVLTYRGEDKVYMIGSEEKVEDPEGIVEPYLSMGIEDCVVEGEGLVDFTLRRTQASFYGYGSASVSIGEPSPEDHLNTLFGFSFPMAKAVVSSLRDNLKEDLRLATADASPSAEMRHALMYHMGADKGGAAYALYSATGDLQSIPQPMQSTMLFDHVRWQYSPTVGLYYDGKVTLVAVGDKSMDLEMKLKAQISKRNNTQQITLYVEAARDHWYFFRYDVMAQELVVNSSVGTWVDQIKAIPLEQRKLEHESLGTFRYAVSNNSGEVQNWLNWLSKTVYSEDEED